MPFDSLGAWGECLREGQADDEWRALVREAFVEKQIVVNNTFSRRLYEVK